jgi:tyrosine-protein kinase Etk/Wzc
MVKAVTEDTYSDGEMNLLDYLIVLAKYGRLIVFVSAAITIITYLCLFLSPNLYTSTARILPPGQNMTLSAQVLNSLGGVGIPGASASQGIGGMAAGLLGLESPAELYVGIMTGDTILDRIIARFNLQKRYHQKYIQNARDLLARMVNISVGKKDNLISIAVTDTDPKRAAEMANAFIAELDKLLRNLTAQEARNRLAFLEKERVRVNHNLTQAENVLRNFSVQKGVIQINAQAKGILEYIANLRAQIDAREVQVEVLRKQATPYNYDVVRLETEIKGLKDKLVAAENRYDPNCVGDVCLPTSKVPALGLEYLRLYREVKFQEALYQLYNQLVEVARLDIARSFPTIQVVDRALPPEQRSNRRLLPAVLAGIVACLMMVLVAFGLEHWQNTLQSAEEEERKKQLMKYIQQWQLEGNRFLNFFKFKKR